MKKCIFARPDSHILKKELIIYPQLIEDMDDWPVNRISKERDAFIRQIDAFTFNRLMERHRGDLSDLIVKTLYQERQRIKEQPWKIDPPDQRPFWNGVSKRMIKRSLDREAAESRVENEELLRQIIHRYSEEIVGTFSTRTFRFARRFLTILFNRLFNAAVGKSFRSLIRGRRNLYERLNIVGEIDTTRSLFSKGTVVVVPTHFSNLDSILVGYAMDQIMGLPAFSYGAGLNLYNFGPAAYYMNRLGAYRVDRRKKNAVYLETLKSMSTLSIYRGVNNLFFPGGTRSRSGVLESDLKMGLLGTAVEAQRMLCQEESDRKVFIVPMVIGYNFVLEAPFLIEQHLRQTGKEQYLRLRDEGSRIRSWLRFFWRFFSTTSDITLSVGRPLDVLGNFVDDQGVSRDRHGHTINIREYFMMEGTVNEDRQREGEYTRILADKLVSRYYAENVVLSSHLVPFAVFEILAAQNPRLDLYGLMRVPADETTFRFGTVEKVVVALKHRLFEMEQQGSVRLASEIYLPADELIRQGVRKLGVFHSRKPLRFNKEGDIVSSDFKVLYYYHNRLCHYGLERVVAASLEHEG